MFGFETYSIILKNKNFNIYKSIYKLNGYQKINSFFYISDLFISKNFEGKTNKKCNYQKIIIEESKRYFQIYNFKDFSIVIKFHYPKIKKYKKIILIIYTFGIELKNCSNSYYPVAENFLLPDNILSYCVSWFNKLFNSNTKTINKSTFKLLNIEIIDSLIYKTFSLNYKISLLKKDIDIINEKIINIDPINRLFIFIKENHKKFGIDEYFIKFKEGKSNTQIVSNLLLRNYLIFENLLNKYDKTHKSKIFINNGIVQNINITNPLECKCFVLLGIKECIESFDIMWENNYINVDVKKLYKFNIKNLEIVNGFIEFFQTLKLFKIIIKPWENGFYNYDYSEISNDLLDMKHIDLRNMIEFNINYYKHLLYRFHNYIPGNNPYEDYAINDICLDLDWTDLTKYLKFNTIFQYSQKNKLIKYLLKKVNEDLKLWII